MVYGTFKFVKGIEITREEMIQITQKYNNKLHEKYRLDIDEFETDCLDSDFYARFNEFKCEIVENDLQFFGPPCCTNHNDDIEKYIFGYTFNSIYTDDVYKFPHQLNMYKMETGLTKTQYEILEQYGNIKTYFLLDGCFSCS